MTTRKAMLTQHVLDLGDWMRENAADLAGRTYNDVARDAGAALGFPCSTHYVKQIAEARGIAIGRSNAPKPADQIAELKARVTALEERVDALVLLLETDNAF